MSNVYYEIYYHIIWTTKRRLELISEDIEEMVKKFIIQKVKELEGQPLEFNSVSDHCHLLSIIPPKISVSDFVGKIKGYSSHEVNKIKGEKFIQWQRGFGVLSLSKKGLPFIRQYIKNQKDHHKNNTIIGILEHTSDD